MAKCTKRTAWGRCAQPGHSESPRGLCESHQIWHDRGTTPDRYYEEKIVRGLQAPVSQTLTAAEIEAMLNGRYRGDGRRIDVYCAPEGPMGISL
jgi:hypothetical protein